ncbi:MAG: insulinase family protein, partial [Lachnospiraceae bacterium]|nr:insulinase family protein [Lachnospiraceae bacterium]
MNDQKPHGEQQICSPDGIPIYYYPGRHLHGFSICLYLRAGSFYEDDRINGASHFLEHMVFRNINRLMDGKMNSYLDRLGLDFNGCTYKEFMQFEIKGASAHFREAADIITRIFEPFLLTAEEIETEKKRIKSEIRESDEKKSLDHFSQQIVWEGTPLRNMIAGSPACLNRMGINFLRDYARELLSLGNLFFYVTGSFTDNDIVYLSKLTGKYHLAKADPVRNLTAQVPERFFNRKCTIAWKNDSFYMVRIAFDIDTSRYNAAENALFYDIMFSGENSKIHQELSEKTGFVYSFGAHYERYQNVGSIYLYYEVRAVNLYESIRRVMKILHSMKKDLTDELDYVIPMYRDNAGLLMDDASDFNWNMAYENHILGEEYPDIEAR